MLFALSPFVLLALTIVALAVRVDAVARSGSALPKPAAAIVVLGARVKPGGVASEALKLRAEKGAELYRQGIAPLVFFSGGKSGPLPSEASVARDIAVKLGVPAEACVLEEDSHSTYENAQLTAPLLRQRGIFEVVLVSDGYHLLRSRLQFQRVDVRSQTVASGRALTQTDHVYWTVREAFALLRRPTMLLAH